MPHFYHLCKIRLRTGSVIEPGNWGSAIDLFGYKHSLFTRENTLENVRREVAPNLPSRLNCVFAFPTANDARAFQHREFSGFGGDYLYEVTPEDEQPNIVTVRLDYLENMEGLDIGRAEAYWKQGYRPGDRPVFIDPRVGEVAGLQEVLIGSPVRIVQCLGRAFEERKSDGVINN